MADIEDSFSPSANRFNDPFFRVKIRSKREKDYESCNNEELANIESQLSWTKKVYMRTWGCMSFF